MGPVLKMDVARISKSVEEFYGSFSSSHVLCNIIF